MKKKNILVLTNHVGGLYSFRKEVMKALLDNGYEVCISAPDDDDERVSYFENIGCHIIKTSFNRRGVNPFADMRLMLRYRKMIKQLKPIAVLTYTVKPNVYGGIACRITGVPQVANITGLGDAIENGGWLQKLALGLYKVGIGNAIQVFFQNQANRDFFVGKGIVDKESMILPGSGVNLSFHRYQDYPPEGKIKFLFIARLLKDKGTDEFFCMAETIKKKYPNTEFQILGWVEGNYEEQLKDLENRGIVAFLGSTTDIRPYLGDVHCTIMPSYHEGMSNVNLESSANGRPVITTNIPGCRETVDDGKTGFLVEPKDAQSLIEAVERFINLPYHQKEAMGREARKKVEREFDRQVVIDEYLKVIRGLD